MIELALNSILKRIIKTSNGYAALIETSADSGRGTIRHFLTKVEIIRLLLLLTLQKNYNYNILKNYK